MFQSLDGIDVVEENIIDGFETIFAVEQSVELRAEPGSVVATAIRPIIFQMLRMGGELLHIGRLIAEQIIDCIIPRRLRIVMVWIGGEI